MGTEGQLLSLMTASLEGPLPTPHSGWGPDASLYDQGRAGLRPVLATAIQYHAGGAASAIRQERK